VTATVILLSASTLKGNVCVSDDWVPRQSATRIRSTDILNFHFPFSMPLQRLGLAIQSRRDASYHRAQPTPTPTPTPRMTAGPGGPSSTLARVNAAWLVRAHRTTSHIAPRAAHLHPSRKRASSPRCVVRCYCVTFEPCTNEQQPNQRVLSYSLSSLSPYHSMSPAPFGCLHSMSPCSISCHSESNRLSYGGSQP